MSHLASPDMTNELVIPIVGLDDKIDEAKAIADFDTDRRFSAEIETTAIAWSRRAKKAPSRAVFVADNRIEALPDLKPVGHAKIKTDKGNCAGFKLLTEYYKVENLSAGLRIIFTSFELRKTEVQMLDRLQKRGANIEVVYKKEKGYKEKLRSLLEKHYELEYRKFVALKLDWVVATMNQWGLSDRERARLFGMDGVTNEQLSALIDQTGSRDIEARCDLIHRLRTNLDIVLGDDRPDLQSSWLRRPVSMFDDRSAFEFLDEGFQDRLADLVFRVEQP